MLEDHARFRYAHQILDDYHEAVEVSLPLPPTDIAVEKAFDGVAWGAREAEEVPEAEEVAQANEVVEAPPVKIGIVGAGAAGLYVALMIDWLQDPQFDYEILESSPRAGGRIFTHEFSKNNCDYYDAGAMRFPRIPWMDPTFDLMGYLEIKDNTNAPKDQRPEQGSLIEYILSNDLNAQFYNDKPLTKGGLEYLYKEAHDFDPFGTQLGLSANPDDILDQQIGWLKDKFVHGPWGKAWKTLMKYDDYSTRSFMKVELTLTDDEDHTKDYHKPALSDQIISYLEMLNSSTNLYDCALSETIMDALDFDYPGEGIKWACILGGTDTITSKAVAKLKLTQHTVQHNKRVTAIAPIIKGNEVAGVDLTINNSERRTYDHVISTMPLSCLSFVDLSKCHLDWELTSAIRQLHYDGSVKVAIKFSKRWWQDNDMTVPQMGGVSSTDRPTRTVVYPSYGLGDPTAAATMIVSYTWAQDAFRMGSFLRGMGDKPPQELLDTILRDLTDMHYITNDQGELDYTILPGMVLDSHAWDWYRNEHSMGAFALFAPGQFKYLYPKLTQPAFGKLHFAGEATSVHHAWIVGALNSGYRSLAAVFAASGRRDLIEKLRSNHSPFQNAAKGEFEVDTILKQVVLGNAHAALVASRS